MSSTEDRLMALARENLDIGREPEMDAEFSNSGVSSVDAVAFIKKASEEFGTAIPPEDFSQFKTLREMAAYLDSHSE